MGGHSQNEIDAKAKAMADLLLQTTCEPDMLAPAWKAYAHVRQELTRRDLAPATYTPSEQSIQRLLFEVIAFAAFIIMGQEVPKRLTRKSPLGEEEPDVEWIRYSNTQFLNRLAYHLESSEFARLREVTVTRIHPTLNFAEGEVLNLERCVAGYLRAGSDGGGTGFLPVRSHGYGR